MSTTRRWTEAELMALPEDGFKRELVDGGIVVSPARRVLDEVGECLGTGVRLAWVVAPAERVATCWRSLTDARLLRADASGDEGELDGATCSRARAAASPTCSVPRRPDAPSRDPPRVPLDRQ